MPDSMDTVVLSSTDNQDFVECSASHVKTSGTLFKKMLFRWGEFSNPNNPDLKVKVDQNFYDQMKKNFDNGICPIVQFPLADAHNNHSEDPARNLGQVVDLTSDDKGVYAYIDVRKNAEDIGKTILGASAKVHLNYRDTRNNQPSGVSLLHVAATNRPYLVDLDDFEAVNLSSVDTSNSNTVLLQLSAPGDNPISEKEKPMTLSKDELIASLNEFGIDVQAGQRAISDLSDYLALSNVLEGDAPATPEALSTAIVELSNSVRERDTAIAEREDKIQSLTTQINEVNLSKAQAEVDSYISAGRILPTWKDDMIELSMNDRERFEKFLLPEGHELLNEVGFSNAQTNQQEDPQEALIARGQEFAKTVYN